MEITKKKAACPKISDTESNKKRHSFQKFPTLNPRKNDTCSNRKSLERVSEIIGTGVGNFWNECRKSLERVSISSYYPDSRVEKHTVQV